MNHEQEMPPGQSAESSPPATVASDSLKDEMRLVTFALGNEEFGFDIMDVKEIIRLPKIARVPLTPEFVDGVANLRGTVLPIVDLRNRFGMARIEDTDRTRVLVIDQNGVKTGLRVDRVVQITRVPRENIEKAPAAIGNTAGEYLDGVVKLDNGKRIIMTLRASKICRTKDLAGSTPEQKTEELTSESALAESGAEVQDSLLQMVTFRLGDEEFGIPISQIREIDRYSQITQIPNMPDYLEGVMNLRGEVITVIGLRDRFSMERRPADDRTRVIIVDLNGKKTGLTVDSVSQVLNIATRDVELPPSSVESTGRQRFISGIAKVDQGKRIIVLLDVAKVLENSDVAVH
jgi:purine-binding chemotaxis protein CheW